MVSAPIRPTHWLAPSHSPRPMTGILRAIEVVRERVPDPPQFPFTIPAIATLEHLALNPRVTFFVGENGSGKSTLIEAIASLAGFNPEGGTKNFRTALRPSESNLPDALRLVREARRERTGFFLRAETMFNVSSEAEGYSDYGWTSLHEMSHGEAFLWVALNKFTTEGLYILDEPEAALSPQRQLALLARIVSLADQGSQFVISTHSPILMTIPGATIYHLDGSEITETSYEETEHFTLTKSFLANPERMLKMMLDEGTGPGD